MASRYFPVSNDLGYGRPDPKIQVFSQYVNLDYQEIGTKPQEKAQHQFHITIIN